MGVMSGSRTTRFGTLKNSSLWWQLSVWHLIQPPRKGCWAPDMQVLLSLLVSPVPVLGQSERVEESTVLWWLWPGLSDTPKSEGFVPTSSLQQLGCWWQSPLQKLASAMTTRTQRDLDVNGQYVFLVGYILKSIKDCFKDCSGAIWLQVCTSFCVSRCLGCSQLFHLKSLSNVRHEITQS